MSSHIWQHQGMTKTPAREILALKLRQLMDAHPTLNTQGRLAARAGLAQRTVGRMRNNEADPQLGHVEAVADALGVSLVSLISDETASASGLQYDTAAVARLSGEDRKKIESYIEFVLSTSGTARTGGQETVNISETMSASKAQTASVRRAAQRPLSDKTLSINEDQSHATEGKRGRR
ncbi:helix-turn-helix domain-containing protein [Burkholderia cenocepacia]|uniref:helix-turn-helix domain-containing protein n=1 Tax=Burkholderia cenocepacia TaxID=95486 RepID=UPI00201256C4|nr:helix-turn-helix transcriptional regulator [Burkholderia cenocepacia]